MTLALKDLSLQYRDTLLLQHITLTLQSAKTLVLLGKSGSGKTLTTLALQGLIPQNITQISGKIFYNQQEVNPQHCKSKIFASIMQNPQTCFNPLFTLQSHIKESLHAISKPYCQSEVESVFIDVGLNKQDLFLYPFEMSGGMLQRAMIAIAILIQAPFLIADEPTTNLDLLIQHKILALLKDIQKTKKIGILLITHSLDIALTMADSIAIIENGRIVEEFYEYKTHFLHHTAQTNFGKILQEKYYIYKNTKG